MVWISGAGLRDDVQQVVARGEQCLGVKLTLEARWTLDEGGQPQVLKDYTTPAIPS